MSSKRYLTRRQITAQQTTEVENEMKVEVRRSLRRLRSRPRSEERRTTIRNTAERQTKREQTTRKKRKRNDDDDVDDEEEDNEIPVSKRPITQLHSNKRLVKPQEKHSKEEKTSNVNSSSESESDSDSDSEVDDGISEYEKIRISNMKENAAFLLNSGFSEAKDLFMKSVIDKKPKIARPRPKPRKEVLPLRQRSQRLQNKDPDGAQTITFSEPVVESMPRKPSGKLNIRDNLDDDLNKEEFLERLQTVTKSETSQTIPQETQSLIPALKRMNLKDVVKTIPNRVFSLAIHPSEDNILVAAGDKWGQIGLLNFDESDRSKHIVDSYETHIRPVNCLRFTMDRLYSCSYDGSLRSCDLKTAVSDELYRTSDDDEERCISFDFYDQQTTVIVALSDGQIVGVDRRAPADGNRAEFSYQLHDRVIKSISVHPVDTHYISTCTNNGIVSLWDLRKINKKKPKSIENLMHVKSLNSVGFSPVTGNKLVTVSMDDRIRVFNTTVLSHVSQQPQTIIKHDCHVGRWLTGFRASWHPASDDVFVMGSMNRPREIVLYSSHTGEILHRYRDSELASVNSLNVFHPTRNILIGGNSSGRIHVFT
ncbi:WD repeat-containing protein 76-like [Tubulanus polymorphus]|uniref:WD repeat-containing protein 76-like n=1 Tax=Tubulanus polymorphus TaxID=672921 RepID=UPI003DA2CFCE